MRSRKRTGGIGGITGGTGIIATGADAPRGSFPLPAQAGRGLRGPVAQHRGNEACARLGEAKRMRLEDVALQEEAGKRKGIDDVVWQRRIGTSVDEKSR